MTEVILWIVQNPIGAVVAFVADIIILTMSSVAGYSEPHPPVRHGIAKSGNYIRSAEGRNRSVLSALVTDRSWPHMPNCAGSVLRPSCRVSYRQFQSITPSLLRRNHNGFDQRIQRMGQPSYVCGRPVCHRHSDRPVLRGESRQPVRRRPHSLKESTRSHFCSASIAACSSAVLLLAKGGRDIADKHDAQFGLADGQ